MKKITFLLTLVLTLLCGATAQAYDWTVGNRVITLTVGNHYAIYNACASDHYGQFWLYDNGASIGATMAGVPTAATVFDLEAKHVWTLESGETTGTYRLKNLGTGQYVDLSGKTNNHSVSLDLYIAHTPTSGSNEYGGDVYDASGVNKGDASKYTGGDVFYITDAVDGHNWTSGWESGFLSTGDGAQAHAFYEVSQTTVDALLSTVNRDHLIKEIADYNAYLKIVEGANPGQYPSSELVAAKEAIAAAQSVIDNNGTEADCATARTTLGTDFAAAMENLTPNAFKDGGVYKIVSAQPQFTDANKVKTIYLDGSTPRWNTFDSSDPYYYWTVNVANGEYSLQNTFTGEYLADHSGVSTTAVAATFNALAVPGQFHVVVGGSTLHANGWNGNESGNLINYDLEYENSSSAWMFVEATSTEIAAMNQAVSDAATEAQDLIKLTGVGYPSETSDARKNLAAALALDPSSPGYGKQLYEAVATYKTTTDVQLPESGKTYAIYAIFPNGNRQAMYWDGSRISTKLGETAIPFVCRSVADGKYVFVNSNGGYLSWFSDTNGHKPNNGCTDSYTVDGDKRYNDLTISRATVEKTSGNILSGTTNEDFFGRVHIQGINENGTLFYLAARRDDGAFIGAGGTDKWYDNNWNGDGNQRTVTFAMEEVSYANLVNFAAGAKIGEDYVATFAAPYPAVVPDNVEAYAITGQNGDYAALSEPIASGNAIPAGEGALLVSKSEMSNVVMLPAAGENTADMSGNLLERATGEAIDATTTAYILANGNDDVGFYLLNDADRTIGMNKAYLAGLSSSAVLKLNFGGNLTGIDAVDNGELTIDNAPVYDLSGRVVANPTKGGIYIKGGKKYIVK